MYIFFCSAIPALAFGEQLVIETGGSCVHHLTTTATKRGAPADADVSSFDLQMGFFRRCIPSPPQHWQASYRLLDPCVGLHVIYRFA